LHCPSIRLAVEIDGGQHGGSAKQASDERRTQWLASKGIVVPRFWNNDVMENFDGVLEKIASTAATMAVVASDPLPDPPPFRGRERESGV
jgi:very-short-patch-repair endonuclease